MTTTKFQKNQIYLVEDPLAALQDAQPGIYQAVSPTGEVLRIKNLEGHSPASMVTVGRDTTWRLEFLGALTESIPIGGTISTGGAKGRRASD